MEKEKEMEDSMLLRPRIHVLSLRISHHGYIASLRILESDLAGFFLLTPASMSQHLWLRCEKKVFERRAALSPKNAKALIDGGFTIHVERDDQRIFEDSEYESYAHFCLFCRLKR